MDIKVGLFIASMDLGSPSIITGAGTSCILLEKELDVAGLSIDIWKTG